MQLTMMIKPASSMCGLKCRYCFYRDVAEHRAVPGRGVMSADTRALLLRRAVESLPPGRSTLHLVFQGGEPMLAGIEWYEELEREIALLPANVRVERSLQTNGVLITGEWARFFKRHGYLVGVSLDGPADLHNAQRPDAGGRGSFARVMSGIACLKKEGVPHNILTVVTNAAARRGAAVYRFLRKNGWDYLQFIPCMDPMDGRREDYSLTSEQYGAFLTAVFREYEREILSGTRVSVRWFDNLIDMINGRLPESCGMTGMCACHFVAEADGSVYPCDFYTDDAHCLGDLRSAGLREMFESEAAQEFIRSSRRIDEECAKCRWLSLCRGGCRRYRDEGESGPGLSRLCGAYKAFFGACGNDLLRLAQLLRGPRL